MDNIRAAMIIDRNMSPLEEEVRQRAMRTVIRMCPDHQSILAMLGLDETGTPQDGGKPDDEPETCKRGHPRTPENLRKRSRGGYRCYACERHTHAERVARKSAEEKKPGHEVVGGWLDEVNQ